MAEMASAKVAIGMPVYNGERWIRPTIESILGQTYTDIQLVVSDNASTDRTGKICEEYAATDSRVRYFRNPENVGVYRNYDLAFERTSSEYFKWCAVGDACDPMFIEKAVAILDRSPDAVLVHSKTKLIGDIRGDPQRYLSDLNLTDKDPSVRFRQYLTRVRLNNVMNGLIRSEQLRQTSLNQIFHASDKCMMAELALRGNFIEIPEELFFRRMQPETSTALKSSDEADEFFGNEPKSPATLSKWKLEISLLKGVLSSPIRITQKLSSLLFVFRDMILTRKTLYNEIVDYYRASSTSGRT